MKMTIYEKEDLIGQLRYCRAWAKQCTEKRYTKNWATEWIKAMHK